MRVIRALKMHHEKLPAVRGRMIKSAGGAYIRILILQLHRGKKTRHANNLQQLQSENTARIHSVLALKRKRSVAPAYNMISRWF
jgi:hypothetical protein